MKFAEKSLRILLGALLLGTVVNSLAVSLGRVRGAAIVGRPLDVTLTVQLDASEGLSAVCVGTDVFFGDSQVSSGKVRIATSAGANAGEALVRIRTTSVVDEPVVTLYAREGCLQTSARKYVLLAEALPDNTGPAALANVPAVPSVPATQPSLASGAGDSRGRAVAPGAGQADATAPARPRKAPAAKPESRAVGASPLLAASVARTAGKNAPEPARSSRARLKLDPIDLTIDRDPVLRSSPELLSLPTTDAQQRSAAAALWQALNAQPQDMARDSQRLKSLESDVAGMLAQGRKTETALTELRGQLEQARGERYANGLVYALGGLLALALAVAAFLWMRSRQHERLPGRGPWWGEDDADGGNGGLESGFASSAVSALQPGGVSRVQTSVVDLNLDELQDAPVGKAATPKPATPARPREAREHPEFLPSLGGLSGMPRIVNAEELFDVQQQADFFLSLGHTDKAVEVLLHHIMDNVETSALVYLDLFDLYHKLGRREGYDALRKDFHRKFNAQVPAFDDYAMDSHGLEFYLAALTRIESLWPTPKVLDVLEESIFRKPDSRNEVFSLAAYRELLLLHSIAKKIITPPAAPGTPSALNTSAALPPGTSFGPTNILPLSAQLQEAPPPLPIALPVPQPVVQAALPVADPAVSAAAPDLTRPPVSSRLGLDIDLSLQAEGALAPLPSIEALDVAPDVAGMSNLIEFDLDTPLPDAPEQKA